MKQPKKILIVEDEKNLNEAYQITLKKEGFKVFAAYDGKEALEITKDVEPDLILLDLRMPKMGGIEFLKAYNLSRKHPDTKVIVFSNLDREKEVDEAYELGTHKYILKAWASPKELVKLVRDVLKT
ncbi:response regulator [Candidatus Parcubacteria bacterium]|nr:response regulator [Candidatus Parcubacteria bacterium]